MRTLNDLMESAASEAGKKAALATAEGELPYAELAARVARTAAGLCARGVGRGDCVAIVLRNSPCFVTAYFALSRLGAVAVPINFLVQKPDELAYMLNDCKAVGVVTQKEFLRGLRAAAAQTPSLARLWVSDASPGECQEREEPFSSLLEEPSAAPSVTVEGNDTACILYTSGTTGNPKGVMLTHRNLLTNAESSIERMGLKGSDVALCILPMFHSFAWTGNVLLSHPVPRAVPLGLELYSLLQSPLVLDDHPWMGMGFGNRQPLFLQKGDVLFHSPPGLIQAVLYRVSDARKAFQVR